MTTTIDKAGRVAIPAEVIVRRGKRLVARPQVAEGERIEFDVARLIEKERDRWPG